MANIIKLSPAFSVENTKFCTSGKVLEYMGERPNFQLGLFNSPISGQGLRVSFGKISKGWPVIRYVGPILTDEQVAKYWAKALELSNNPRVELFALDTNRTINGARALAAFVNHSCAPNCRVHTDPSKDLVAFYAFREIFQGEELTIDYGLHTDAPDGAQYALHPCKCGAKTCRGYMDSIEMIKKFKGKKVQTCL